MTCFSRLGTAVSFAKAGQEIAEKVEEGLDGEGFELKKLLERDVQEHVQPLLETALRAARPLLYDRLKKEICRKPDGALVKLNKKLEEKKKDSPLPGVKPGVKRKHVEVKWEHVQAVLERVDTLEKLQATAKRALHDPEAFLQGLASGAMPAATELVLSRFKRSLKTHLETMGIDFETTVAPALAQLTTMQALEDAFRLLAENPEGFPEILHFVR